jgi:predicted murein hydrolase (TIGR00659 family)
MIDIFTHTPYFGIILSIAAYLTALGIYKKTKIAVFNPLLLTVIFIIIVLTTLHIPIEKYNEGGNLIVFFLAPATVVLAVPLYKQLNLLKEHFIPIMAGVTAGSFISILSVIGLSKLFGLEADIIRSLVPKSITTPLGMEISRSFGGIIPITVASIVLTGILGAVIGPFLVNIAGIKSNIAKGIGIGTGAHAIGTSKAIEMGEVEGAMSGLAIGLAGIITVVIAPIFYKIFF